MTLHEHMQRQIALSGEASLMRQLAMNVRSKDSILYGARYNEYIRAHKAAKKELRYVRTYVRCMILAPKTWRYRIVNDITILK